MIDIPLIVDMLGSYDIWDFHKYSKEKCNELQCGMRLEDTSPISEIWRTCFIEDVFTLGIIDKGHISLLYRDNVWKSMVEANAFWANFEGYNCICINAMQVSSDVFASVTEDYDLMIPFYFNGINWTISLYTKKDIDCGTIAKKYGGGGHFAASGFQSGTLPFKFIKRLKDA
jgi:oligoribonuclease NrnB/cAMP/cGMP phosphodiesterase (DHH superfamily)